MIKKTKKPPPYPSQAPPHDVMIAERLDELRTRGLRRRLRLIEGPQGPRVLLDGRPVLLLCSNNYLGLAEDPAVRARGGRSGARAGAPAPAPRG